MIPNQTGVGLTPVLLARLEEQLRQIRASADDLFARARDGGREEAADDLDKVRAATDRLAQLAREASADHAVQPLPRETRHDLMTPINHILGYAEMLREDAGESDDAGARDELAEMIAGARRLLEIIDAATDRASVPPARPAELTWDTARAAPAPRLASLGGTDSEPATILVVDDDETNRDVLIKWLQREGLKTLAAEDGRQALDILSGKDVDLLLLDVMMRGMDGYEVLGRLKSDPQLQHLPVLMISGLTEIDSVVRCIEMGAADYLPKPFDPVLLRARIGACLEKKRLRDQERLTFAALQRSQAQLAAELAEASTYVRSLLPAPISGDISTAWRFIPSTTLGGDAFGYAWLDPDHLAIYLLDVCGHGVGAALLSISVVNLLRAQALPSVNFRDPSAVLGALNNAFPMEEHSDRFFTIWYGVYQPSTREMVYASGGHPPAVLVAGDASHPDQAAQLTSGGMIVGMMPDVTYESRRCRVGSPGVLFVFSDGVYEVSKSKDSMLPFKEFVQCVIDARANGFPSVDRVLGAVRQVSGREDFEDDVSILEVSFAPEVTVNR